MSPERSSLDTAALVLRVTQGSLFLAHAWQKYAVFTPAGAAQFFAAQGLPAELAYVTIAAEAVGGIALILGIYTSVAALALLPVLIGATAIHAANGFFFTASGGGLEFPLLWTAALIAQVLIGGGAYAITSASRSQFSSGTSPQLQRS